MNKHQRIASFFTAALMVITFLSSFSSCGMKEFFNDNKSDDNKAQGVSDDGNITNSEWLSMLNNAFGIEKPDDMDEIENAKDWGFVKEDEEIDPNALINDEFATKTLMRASGFVSRDATDEEIARAAVEHGIVTPDSNMSDPEQATEAMAEASYQWKHQTFDYYENIEYNENVYDFSQAFSSRDFFINADEDRVTMPTAQANKLAKDDVFVLPPDDVNTSGLAMKALSISDNGDGTSTVISSVATLEELYSQVQVSGCFSPDYNDIESLDDQVIITSGGIEDVVNSSDEPCYIRPLSNKADDGSMVYDENIKPMASVPGSFTVQVPIKSKKGKNGKSSEIAFYATFSNININANVDLDLHLFKKSNIDAYVTLDYKEAVGIKMSGTAEESQEFEDAYKGLSDEAMAAAMNGEIFEAEQEIARVPVEICPGLSIDFVVSFVVTANGYISFEMSYQHTKGFEMHNSKIQIIDDVSKGDPAVKVSGSVGLLFSFSLRLQFHLVRESLVTIDLRVGPKLEAKMNIYNDVVCFDISFYCSASISLKFHSLVEKILNDPKLIYTIWDSSNSPMKASFHCELRDGHFNVVSGCTHGKNNTTTTTKDNQPKYHVGDLVLEKAYYSLKEGSSMTIGIKTMPSDLKVEDLVWSSSDTSKVTVDSIGNITAVSEGTANITVTSKDGKHSYSCSVTVTAANGSKVNFEVHENPSYTLIAA